MAIDNFYFSLLVEPAVPPCLLDHGPMLLVGYPSLLGGPRRPSGPSFPSFLQGLGQQLHKTLLGRLPVGGLTSKFERCDPQDSVFIYPRSKERKNFYSVVLGQARRGGNIKKESSLGIDLVDVLASWAA